MAESIHPVQLEIFRNLLKSIAEEMGTVLRRTSYSPNIKERRDYSCAIFDGDGRLLEMGDHMPVHLGSMPMSVRFAREAFPLKAGDLVILNDPFAGGTHLPDITMVLPVLERSGPDRPLFFVAARAHHSDVGGITPGSMPMSRDIFQEGLRIPPVKLYRRGRLQVDLLRLLLNNVRTSEERDGDLAAQVAALKVGERRLVELAQKHGRKHLQDVSASLREYAARIMAGVISAIPDGRYQGEDVLDDDGTTESTDPIKIRLTIEVSSRRIRFDFSGSDPQVSGSFNAVEAITVSAVQYALRCLAPSDVPNSAGLMQDVEVKAPAGSVVNACFPAATAAGNVETSQRIVDVIFRVLATALPQVIPAASSGTMNNLTIGALDPVSGQPFSYYETIGGGMGAGPLGPGDSGIHTHMTNSLNTPVEALEPYFPIRVRAYRIRHRSGGRGRFRGGDGVVRSLEMLTDCQVTLLSERRRHAPYGLEGGSEGKKGRNSLLAKGRRKTLPGKFSLQVAAGETVSIETPGGGGWGKTR